jgi:single-strand DNA-binding protein
MSVNVHTVVGRLGMDVDVREISNGRKVATLSVATTERFIKDGERTETTDWHRAVCFKPSMINYMENYAKKGTLVYISGRHRMDSYQGSDGSTKKVSEIIVNEFKILAKGKDKTNNSSYKNEPTPF